MGDPEPIFRVLVTLKWEGRRRPCLLQLLFYVYGKIANKRCSIKKNSKIILDPTWKYKSIQVFKYSSHFLKMSNPPTNNVKARDPVGSKKY